MAVHVEHQNVDESEEKGYQKGDDGREEDLAVEEEVEKTTDSKH